MPMLSYVLELDYSGVYSSSKALLQQNWTETYENINKHMHT